MAEALARIDDVARRIRANFESGMTLPYAFRMQQLQQVKKLFLENQEELGQAIKKDLGLTSEFGFFREYEVMIREEIDIALKNLKSWMKEEKVEAPLWLIPGSCKVMKQPVGVVLIIAPWNYPYALLFNPLVGAIAAGCAAVIKPSEVAPNCSAAVARLLPKYLAPEVYAVIEGGVSETTHLLKAHWDHIFYTGSTAVGKVVMRAAAEHLTPVTLELGGKSPCYIDASVNMAVTAKRIAFGKFNNCGQTCVAPDYILVNEKVKDEFHRHFVKAVKELYTETPLTCPDYSRVVNGNHVRRLAGLLKGEKGKVVCGGEFDPDTRFFSPTLVADANPEGELMKDEIFGPILPTITVSGVDEALRFINNKARPLAAYVFSSDSSTQDKFVRGVTTGSVGINEVALQVCVSEMGFGGAGASGIGRYHGKLSFDTFSNPVSVLKEPFYFDAFIKYPPFSSGRIALLRRLLHMPTLRKIATVAGVAAVGVGLYVFL